MKSSINKKIAILLLFIICLSYPKETGDIIITEISPKGEWLEISNNSENSIDLLGWKISDVKNEDFLVNTQTIIKSKEIILFADYPERFELGGIVAYKLPSKITLNNDGDTVEIYSPNKILSDRIGYNEDIVNSNSKISLTRLNISSFAISNDFWANSHETPGYINPKTDNNLVSNIRVITGPILFTPNGDGIDDYYKIKIVNGEIDGSIIELYSFNGDKLFETFMPQNGEYLWMGICDNGSKFPTGPFFLIVRFNNGRVVKKEAVLWR